MSKSIPRDIILFLSIAMAGAPTVASVVLSPLNAP